MSSLSKIYEGWKNHLFPPAYLKEQIALVSQQRLDICRECPLNSINATKAGVYQSIRVDEHCTDCGCTLEPKTKCLSCSCPVDKWTSVLTPEEEQKINSDEKTV